MTRPTAAIDGLQQALVRNALAGELDGFGPEDQAEAASFIADVAAARKPGELAIRIESTGGEAGRRRMRIAIINDDMPFLVDSIANAIAARHLTIHRLLHPVVCVDRDAGGKLLSVEQLCDDKSRRESMVYIELDRADARGRRELDQELRAVLSDVRVAVRDWRKLQDQMRADAATIDDPEGAALLNWFADGAMTLLGYEVERPGEAPSNELGIFSIPGAPTDKGGSIGAIRYFEKGGAVPLIAKAERKSTVHRRVPLDLVAVPIKENGKITGIGVHAGLWTSQALILPTEEVPVLRKRLKELDKAFGFDPKGHSGKALRHAVASVPRDLLINLSAESGRELVTMAMSLADRPRPALLLLRSILQGHLFAFVWLPRDEMNTDRRIGIGEMLEEAAGRPVTSWSVELGEGDLALIRYTLDIEADDPTPDAKLLDRKLDAMVRGWEPSVEEALIGLVGAGRATRLALSYAGEFPDTYCSQTSPGEAALDILRLQELDNTRERDARFHRETVDGKCRLRLKTYRRGGLIPLSDAVPVLENFGFRVLEEIPTELDGESKAHIHDCLLELPAEVEIDSVLSRADTIERAIADVLGGQSENDAFNQLVLFAGLETRAVVWLRAWFRYLRQTGVAFGIATVVDALRVAPDATAALVRLFTSTHDPAAHQGRSAAVAAAAASFDEALKNVRGIDDDRILRLMRAVVGATLRTNAFAFAAGEALAFKIDSKQVPGLAAPIPYREIWVYSPRVEGIHLRGGPIARGGLRWSDRRDDFRTEILGLMKAQLVKNAVIVPTGAKGGFYAKQLPNPAVDRRIGELLGVEAALRTGRNDNGVLDQLSLHQAKDLGAEIVAPVGPAQAATSDRAAAQVDALDARAVDPDFAIGDRRGEAGHLLAVDLEGQCFAGRKRKGIGAQRRADHRPHQPEDSIVVDTADILECFVERSRGGGDGRGAPLVGRRVVRRRKEPDQRGGCVRRHSERIDHRRNPEGDPRLPQIAEPCAKPHDRARLQSGEQHQLVECVVFGLPAKNIGDRPFDRVRPGQDGIDFDLGRQFEQAVVDVSLRLAVEFGRNFLQHPEAEILENRNRVRKGNQAATTVGLQAQTALAVDGFAMEARITLPGVIQFLEPEDIQRGLAGTGLRTISVGKLAGIAERKPGRAPRADQADERFLDARLPATDHRVELAIEQLGIGRRVVGFDVQRVADKGKVALAELDRPAGDRTSGGFFQHFADADPPIRVHLVARQPDEGE